MPPASDTAAVLIVASGVGAAAAVDLCTRRIPNLITITIATVGIALAAAGVTRIGIGGALVGFAFGMLLMLPGHVLGATGAGDVKLMAAVGTVLGPHIVMAFLYTAVAGGILALVVARARGRLAETIGRTARLVSTARQASREVHAQGAANRFPYGPAIAIGSMLATLG